MLQRVSGRLRGILPQGGSLQRRDWAKRHRAIMWLLWLHVVATAAYGIASGYGVQHSVSESIFVALWGVVASANRLTARVRAAAASLGLLTASALLVHLAGGAIEAHFHFFV